MKFLVIYLIGSLVSYLGWRLFQLFASKEERTWGDVIGPLVLSWTIIPLAFFALLIEPLIERNNSKPPKWL